MTPMVTGGASHTSGMKIAGFIAVAIGVVVFGGLAVVFYSWSSSAEQAADMARRHMGSGPIARALQDKADSQATMALAFGLLCLLTVGGGAALVVVGGKQGAPLPKVPFAGPAQVGGGVALAGAPPPSSAAGAGPTPHQPSAMAPGPQSPHHGAAPPAQPTFGSALAPAGTLQGAYGAPQAYGSPGVAPGGPEAGTLQGAYGVQAGPSGPAGGYGNPPGGVGSGGWGSAG